MKKIIFFFLYLCLFSNCNVKQISLSDQVNLVSSLEAELGLIDRTGNNNKSRKNGGEENYTYHSLSSITGRHRISIQYSDDTKLIKKSYKGLSILPVPAISYKRKLELFSEYAYYESPLKNIPEEKKIVTFFAYYKNFFFHIQGDKDFIDKSILKICEELSDIYTN